MVPDQSHTSLGLEYFVQEGDALWSANDKSLIQMATEECVTLGLIEERDLLDAVVIRMPKAYPIYDAEYETHLACIKGYIDTLPNLQLVGRNGQHRYNNQDHSMLSAIYAARNVFGSNLDVWQVNLEPDYHERVEARPQRNGYQLAPRHNPTL